MWVSLFLFSILVFLTIPFEALRAEDHLVCRSDLQQAVLAASSNRQNNIAKVQKFLAAEPVQKALASTGLKSSKIEKAIPQLSDEELARLARQTDKIQNDLAAGALTNEQLTYVIIALATAVLILIIVAAR
jgi:biopolymer transport protein ExbB/TolQ